MKINANMSAVLTNNQLLRTENRLSSAMEKLSSGLKLNSAEDNPAGMAISNKMKAQIDALDQAEDNATDGISVLQIADGALSEVHSMLQRMRELSVQAANGTNSVNDRESIQKEMEQLTKEITRISEDTEYNTKNLLDGSSDVRTYADHATRINVSDYVEAGDYAITVKSAAKHATETLTLGFDKESGTALQDTALAQAFKDEGVTNFGITINNTLITVDASMSGAHLYEALREGVETANAKLSVDENGNQLITTNKVGNEATIKFATDHPALAEILFGLNAADFTQNEETLDYERQATFGQDVEVEIDVDNSRFTNTATATSKENRVTITDMNGFQIDFLLEDGFEYTEDDDGNVVESGYINFEVTDIGSMTIQLGANEYQTMDVRIPEVSGESLYLDKIDLSKDGGSEDAMEILDDAIAAVSLARSRIGASQNRLEYAVSSLAETQEDMTSAYSTITDTDMAEAMTEYTQQTVLDQAAISVLSQANEIPQQVLSLLGR